jgi:hypothetical protein
VIRRWRRGAGAFRGWALLLSLAVAAAVGGGGLAVAGAGGEGRSPGAPRPTLAIPMSVAPGAASFHALHDAAGIDLSGSPTRATSTVANPTEIDIPTIGVHAAVVSLGRNADGSMQVPSRFDVAGWYQDGPRPGDPGPAVIVGHVDSFRAAAVFFHLRELAPGETITVSGDGGFHRFKVESVATFPKDRFPTDLVFGPVPERALRLITCGGSFDDAAHSYRANIVVFASEVSP